MMWKKGEDDPGGCRILSVRKGAELRLVGRGNDCVDDGRMQSEFLKGECGANGVKMVGYGGEGRVL